VSGSLLRLNLPAVGALLPTGVTAFRSPRTNQSSRWGCLPCWRRSPHRNLLSRRNWHRSSRASDIRQTSTFCIFA